MSPRRPTTQPSSQSRSWTNLAKRSSCKAGPVGTARHGSILIVVLVVLTIVGLLSYQSVRTLLVIRRGQIQQNRIAQARELLDLAKQLDQSNTQKESIKPGQFSILIRIGDEYGKLELVQANQSEQGTLEDFIPKQIWIAKLPVDSQGSEIPGSSPVVVSLERLSRK